MTQQVVLKTREMQLIEAREGRSMDEILRQLRITEMLTVEQVGDRLGITKGAASRWLERFGIERPRTTA